MVGPRDYSAATRAALAMLSLGRCYFPECPSSIMRFIDGEPYIDYQIAHIRDAKPGNRYVETMTEDERRSFANVILLCKPHHELVDKRHPERFSIQVLEGWKHTREGVAMDQLATVGPVTEEFLADVLTQLAAALDQDDLDAAVDAAEGELNRVAAFVASFANRLDDGIGFFNSSSAFGTALVKHLDTTRRTVTTLGLIRALDIHEQLFVAEIALLHIAVRTGPTGYPRAVLTDGEHRRLVGLGDLVSQALLGAQLPDESGDHAG